MTATVSCAVLYQSHRQVERAAIEHGANIARIAQRSISRNVELLTLALDSLTWRYRHTQLHEMPLQQKMEFLLGENIEARYVAALGIVDTDGELVVGSAALSQILPGPYAQSDFFTAHQAHHAQGDTGLYISAPLTVRLERRMQVVVLSKRLAQPDGSFAGISLMVLYLDYFRDLFQGLTLENDGVISLYSADGLAYMRIPYNEAFIGSRLNISEDLERIFSPSGPAQGSYFARAQQDGPRWLYTFARVPGTGWTVFIGRTGARIFREWYNMLYAVLFLMASFCIASLYLIRRVRVELQRRSALDQQLEELARTDKLTSLLNRRALDEALARAWKRAEENPDAIFSLLFVDVDFFKLYNDTYGHKAGDYALMAVSRCIVAAVSRLSDQSGRYGGEEFVVLLNGTDTVGATHVAKRIISAIQSLKIPHERSPFDILTVSIGVTSLLREHHSSIEDVVKDADAALYRAKQDGRNKHSL
ncbi:diguanylate cyclase (GGDEF)-like protein [Herbaspirillum seropedicae]|uniref:sensor domain-containing diguanylate cyclase n=1 Tax=Herbaspirillum seropedicae TaxID=964 RepID=UPI0033978D25